MNQKDLQKNELTDENFWNDFWQSVKLPAVIDHGVQWHLALMEIFENFCPKDSSLKLFEVGCAPGRWLIWFNKNMGYQVAGCDNSSYGWQITKKNLELNGVIAELYQADLFNNEIPQSSFDIVLSLGVIEHFDNPLPLIQRHLDLLKPGGMLILEVPNMAGWLNFKLLESAGMNDLLRRHNLSVMNKNFFLSVAEQFHLTIKFLDYVGGFDAGMMTNNHSYKSRRARPFILHILCLLNKLCCLAPKIYNLLICYNAAFCSNMLLAVFVKPI